MVFCNGVRWQWILMFALMLASLGCSVTGTGSGSIRYDFPDITSPSKQDPDYGTPARKTSATQRPYTIKGKTYHPISEQSARGFREQGIASWYGHPFHGRKTSNGETYDMHKHTAAHKTLPMNLYVRVHNRDNGRSTIVRINDRGPFHQGRIIDLSKAAALEIDMVSKGVARVQIEVLGYHRGDAKAEIASYRPEEFRDAGDLSTGEFSLQVGAFRDRDNASAYADRFSSVSRRDLVRYDHPRLGIVWRVRVGDYRTLEAARRASESLEAQGIANFVVAR